MIPGIKMEVIPAIGATFDDDTTKTKKTRELADSTAGEAQTLSQASQSNPGRAAGTKIVDGGRRLCLFTGYI